MVTKYRTDISKDSIKAYIRMLKNKIYKLLPLREEGLDWDKYLETIQIEVAGFTWLMEIDDTNFISLQSKLEGLYLLDEFSSYRKTIFECLNILENFEKKR